MIYNYSWIKRDRPLLSSSQSWHNTNVLQSITYANSPYPPGRHIQHGTKKRIFSTRVCLVLPDNITSQWGSLIDSSSPLQSLGAPAGRRWDPLGRAASEGALVPVPAARHRGRTTPTSKFVNSMSNFKSHVWDVRSCQKWKKRWVTMTNNPWGLWSNSVARGGSGTHLLAAHVGLSSLSPPAVFGRSRRVWALPLSLGWPTNPPLHSDDLFLWTC